MDTNTNATDADASRVNTHSKPWYRTLGGWKLRLEVFAIPFVMLYAVVSYLQWRDLRGNFELNERAWISPEAVSSQPATLRVGDEAFINVSFKNSGKTPARDLFVTLAVETIQSGKAPAFSYARNDRARFGLLPPNGSTSMRVSTTRGTHGLGTSGRAITAPFLNMLTSAAAVLYVHGHVIYQDIFNQYHWTTFCYAMEPREASVGFGYCPEHNDVGDGKSPMFTPQLPLSVWR